MAMVRTITHIEEKLKKCASHEKALNLARFFKTGKGQYGEGDKFLGIVVPDIRKVAKEFYQSTSLDDYKHLIQSPFHEVRLCALIMLVYQFEKANGEKRKAIYDLYLANTKYINNWDLVDLSAPNIVGSYLVQISKSKYQIPNKVQIPIIKRGITTQLSVSNRNTKHLALSTKHSDLDPILLHLAKSDLLWDRRIAMLATFAFIKSGRHEEAFAIAEILLHDTHDLMHKAVGWMLREVGKRVSQNVLRTFLNTHGKEMPRTMLRYAIEHFSTKERRHYIESTRSE